MFVPYPRIPEIKDFIYDFYGRNYINDNDCIQYTLSLRALGLAFRPSVHASKGILHTTIKRFT